MASKISYQVDNASVIQALAQMNKAQADYESAAVRAGATIDGSIRRQAQGYETLAIVHRSTFDRMVGDVERYSRGVEHMGLSLEGAFHGMERATKGAIEFAGAVALGTKALVVHASATEVFEASMNRIRAARIGIAAFTEGLGGAAVVGTEIAAVVAIEKAVAATYDRAKQLQNEALQSARSGLNYSDTVSVNFAASRAGVSPDFLTNVTKAAGGVSALGDELKHLADIRDPLDQAQEAVAKFGKNADEVLTITGSRFSDNLQLVKDYGLELDKVGRERIFGFKADVDSLAGSFHSLGDEIKAASASFGQMVESDVAGVWNLLVHGTADLVKGAGRRTGLTVDTLDSGSILQNLNEKTRQDNSADLVLQSLARNGPLATNLYAKHLGSGQDALRSEISTLEAQLFDRDPTSPNYQKLIPGSQFPGGYRKQAAAEDLYISDRERLTNLEHEKTLKEQIASAQKSITKELAGENTFTRYVQEYSVLKKGTEDQQEQYAFGLSRAQSKVTEEFDKRARETHLRAEEEALKEITERARLDESMTRLTEEQAKQGGFTGDRDHRDAMQAFAGIAPSGPSGAAVQARTQAEMRAELNSARLQPGADPLYLAQKEFDLRKQEADYELKAAGNTFDARYANETRLFELRKEHENQIAEVQRKQYDEIKNTSADLFTTLFTHPSHFGRQLGDTLHSAVLRPITAGLGGLAAQALRPVIFGEDGSSGIAGGLKGLFGGSGTGLDSLHLVGGAVPVVVVGAGSSPAESIHMAGTGGGFTGGGGLTGRGGLPLGTLLAATGLMQAVPVPVGIGGGGYVGSGSVPDVTSSISYGAYGGGVDSNIFSDMAPMVGGPGGTGGFAGPVGSVGTGGLMRSLGLAGGGGAHSAGSTSALGGLRSGLSNLKTNFGIGQADFGGTPGVDGAPGTDLGMGTTFSSVANSSGTKSLVGAGGMYLAQRGLLGQDRGTGKGVLEGTAGGAAIGFEYGGPIGAGIGAAVGLGIGLGEMAAGVISPMNKAKQFVQQDYHLSISDKEANQIVAIADNKYAHNVNVAVRSPEVRSMLGLYGAATGQNITSTLGVTTPRTGSVVEEGGNLFQTSSYMYGQAYQYQSSLPTLGPGGTNYPGGQAPQISLNISGAAVAPFMTGQYVTPDFVAAQANSSLLASNGRTSTSALIQSPGLIVS